MPALWKNVRKLLGFFFKQQEEMVDEEFEREAHGMATLLIDTMRLHGRIRKLSPEQALRCEEETRRFNAELLLPNGATSLPDDVDVVNVTRGNVRSLERSDTVAHMNRWMDEQGFPR